MLRQFAVSVFLSLSLAGYAAATKVGGSGATKVGGSGSTKISAVSSAYVAYATQFAGDGQCDIEISGVSTGTNSLKFMLSFWFKFTGGNATLQDIFVSNNGSPVFSKETSNALRFTAADGSTGLDVRSTTTYTADSTWHHCAISVDKTIAVARCQVYMDGVSDANIVSFNHANDSQTFTLSDFYWAFGAYYGRSNSMTAAVSEFYWNDSASLDLSNSANLQKFRTAGGKPADMGLTGNAPTGSPPRIYLRDPYTSFYTDRSGNGNNFTKQGTTALASATAP